MPVRNLDREDLVSLFHLLSIQLIILREVTVHKTRQRMPIRPQPHISIFICMLVDHLFPQPAIGIPVTHHGVSSGPLQVFLLPLRLLPVEFFLYRPGLHLLLMLVVLFLLFDFLSVLFLKLEVFSHDLVHVVVINIHINHLFALF